MKKAGLIMILGSLLLLGLFKFPLWNIMLGAPQYPDPLGMNIYIEGIKGVKEFDIQNIDGLNHYIGMKIIPEPKFWLLQQAYFQFYKNFSAKKSTLRQKVHL